MIPTFFVLVAIGIWGGYKILTLMVENKELKIENEFLKTRLAGSKQV
jgi:hypothetical protein